ncbi:hypothetical protein BBJ28_00025474 [Nothophytophthora sp. Chile5]|nr:hypothetical protein BBJ28_00025474 [Nothophytophthora sp. Chile5]
MLKLTMVSSHVTPVARSDGASEATTPRSNRGNAAQTLKKKPSAAVGGTAKPGSQSHGAAIPVALPRRKSTWSQSASSMLKLVSETTTINVLRTSLLEMNDRVRYRWVLHPQSPFKTLWDLTSALVVLYYSWIIPFMLCFEWYEPSTGVNIFMKVLDVWGFLDIALRFRTGIIEYGTVVMNPHAIRRAYVRSLWFPIDLASSIPFEYVIKDGSSSVSTRKTFKMIKYIKLPRLLRIGRFVKYLKRYRRYSSLAIALNTVIFSAHAAGCLWVAILKPCEDPLEADKYHCASGRELDVYWVAFQHGMVSLLGVSATHVEDKDRFLSGGYNHQPSDDLTSKVYLWSSGVSVVGAVISAVLVGTIINLVQRQNRTLSEQLDLLNDRGMSLALRQQIAIYLFKDYLQKIPFFQLATDAVLGMICMQLRQVIYMPDDFIIREGEIGKELFMIVKGIVRVLPPNDAPHPETEAVILLGGGDFFGEIGVIMEVERTRSVKAESMAELCILSREGFDKILVEFPEFATAMKRLIAKRVSEMWKDDSPERMEKMTALADAKMKKSIQAYKNVQKLRTKARALQTIIPRLSKIVSSASLPSPSDLTMTEESTMPEDADFSVPISMEALNSIAESEATPDSEGDGLSGGSRAASDPLDLADDDEVAAVPPAPMKQGNPVAMGYNDRKPLRASSSTSSSEPPVPSARLQQFETQLRLVEQRMDARMADMDSKLDQILQYLASAGTGIALAAAPK